MIGTRVDPRSRYKPRLVSIRSNDLSRETFLSKRASISAYCHSPSFPTHAPPRFSLHFPLIIPDHSTNDHANLSSISEKNKNKGIPRPWGLIGKTFLKTGSTRFEYLSVCVNYYPRLLFSAFPSFFPSLLLFFFFFFQTYAHSITRHLTVSSLN